VPRVCGDLLCESRIMTNWRGGPGSGGRGIEGAPRPRRWSCVTCRSGWLHRAPAAPPIVWRRSRRGPRGWL